MFLAARAWLADYAPSMGAALAYYCVFSMAPFLLIVISIAGLLFGVESARASVLSELSRLMGPGPAAAVQTMLASLSKPETSALSATIGSVFLFVGATTVFAELQNDLDRIWHVPARDRASGWWSLVRARVLSFGMILAIAFLLVVSLVASAAVSALARWWSGAFVGWAIVLQAVNEGVFFLLTTAVFALIYKVLPNAFVRWQDAVLGAIPASLLFSVGRYLIGLYIGSTGIATGFGAAGSVAVIFIWIYYSAQIFLFGAEVAHVRARARLGEFDGG